MRVPFVDLAAQYATIQADIHGALARVLSSQTFILGAEVEAFESELSGYLGARNVVGVSSGTDALLVSLMALGVGAGDEVVTTPFSFLATAHAIARLGARPVFVDLTPGGFAVDPTRIDDAITLKTKAIVPVHLFGDLADMVAIAKVASARRVPIIEDAAQAIGASRDGLRVGEGGTLTAFSFFPTKNLGAYGDAGAVATDDDALAVRVRSLRAQGQTRRHLATEVGGNFRLDALQAAILRVKLTHLRAWTSARKAVAERYMSLFAGHDLGARLVLPEHARGSVHHQFVIRTKARDALRAHLEERGIGCEVYYPTPLHVQPCFAGLGYRAGDFPEAEHAAREVLALPIYPELTGVQQVAVVEAIAAFFAAR